MTREQMVQLAREMVAYAKPYVEEIEFSPMDASRSGEEFLYELVEAVIAEGATIINLTDTTGYPEEFGPLFARIRRHVRGGDRVMFSAHCHNDLGLAVANSLAAIRHGAAQVEVCVNGVGERAGNCSLEELVIAIGTRGESLGVETGIRIGEIYETSRLVSRMMHIPIAYNKPIVGRNAFQHESGIHQDGLLKNRSTYGIMDPEAMGIPRDMIVLGKHSGRHALRHRLAEYGIVLRNERLEDLYHRFKARADERKVVTDDVLLQLVGESTAKAVEPCTLVDLQVVAGTQRLRIASVTVRTTNGGERTCTGAGEGPLEAVAACTRQASPDAGEFEDLELHSLSCGENAFGEATVTVLHRGRRFRGTAIHRDIILAVARACISACNYVLMAQGSGLKEASGR